MIDGSADGGPITAQGQGVLNTVRRLAGRAWNNLRSIGQREAVHYPALDGLRAIAVLQVLAFHVYFLGARHLGEARYQALIREMSPWWNWVWQGDKGVDLFFVLSGFLISSGLLREHRARGRVSLYRYMVRRGARILPAYYLLLLAAVAFQVPHFANVWVNLLFLNNLLEGGNAFVPWSWSIAVEVQFYLLFPLLLLSLLVRVRRPAGLAVAVLLLFVTVRLWVIGVNPEYYQRPFFEVLYDDGILAGWMNDVYIHLYTRATPILIGVLAAVLHMYHGEWLRRFSEGRPLGVSLITAGALLLLAASAGPPLSDPDSGYYQNLGAGGNLLLLGLHRTGFSLALGWLLVASLYPAGLARPIAGLLGIRLWIGVAKVSYSLYLIHIFVIGWVLTWARPWLSTPGHDSWVMLGILGIAALVGLALASLSYALVEKPGIDAGKRLLDRSRSDAPP